jgi:beta-N-acetylhexosaminidase
LFARRTVPLDSLMTTVGTRAFQDQADDLAVRALTLVRDIGGPLHALQARRTRLALIAYADERNSSVGQRIVEALRAGGNSVDYFRLWPMSGTPSYDSARATIARDERVVFVAQIRPITARGTITMPDSLVRLITATDSTRPTVLVSLGSPYLLDQTPTVKSYLLAWSAIRAAERAVGLALLGHVPIAGHLPIRLPPYPVGHGIVVPAVNPP